MKKLSETSRIIHLPHRLGQPANAKARLESILNNRPIVVPEHDLGWPGTPWTGTRKKCTCNGSCQQLLDIQVEALTEALLQLKTGKNITLGTINKIGVGGGKTLICLLLPSILPAKRPVYLVPAKLRNKTLVQLPELKRHWKIRNDILIHSYDEVSRNPELLNQLKADLILCDEAHSLSRLSSGRTRRVLRSARANPDIRWVMLSGTFDKRSPKDSAHLVELALREGSYLPRSERELESWHNVLGSRGAPEATDWGTFRPMVDAWGRGIDRWNQSASARKQLCREALETRARDTRGVVSLQTMSCNASIVLRRVKRRTPIEIVQAVREMVTSGEIPGSSGAKSIGDQEISRVSETLSLGFYYRWAWERTSAGEPDKEWLNARSFWSSELSTYLAVGGQGEREGVDTPGHVAKICMSDPGRLPKMLIVAYNKWQEFKNKYSISYLGETSGSGEETIPVEPVWITEEVLDWMMVEFERPETIVWYKHRAVARALKDRGVRVFLRGEAPKNDGVSCALSEHSHGEGFNLESFGRMVITCPAPNGAHIEQLIGRVHRTGQDRDEIQVDLWAHTDRLNESIDRALVDARYLHASGTPQRLIMGTWE